MPIDYFDSYVSHEGFDVPRLIHDDFFVAIKLCFNAQLYTSADKLLMCFIDAMGFVRFGDSADTSFPFKEWCRRYIDLAALGITADELWEHRNALIHTTTLRSRKVLAGKTPMLIAYIGKLPPGVAAPEGQKWFDLFALIKEIAAAVKRFLEDFVAVERELFVERYDQVVSDRRVARIRSS